MLSFEDARATVIREVRRKVSRPPVETVSLGASLHRILAEEVRADRDYPPFDRSTRDGFAVRAADVESVPATLRLIGEVRAGETFAGQVSAGECVRIMTGAPAPPGADAVVMVEHTESSGQETRVRRTVGAGENIVPRGKEGARDELQLSPGARLGYPEIAVLGQSGHARVRVYRRPRVAVLSTGDEVVGVGDKPGPAQIRNSNCYSLAAQVELAGGEPVILGNAPDDETALEASFRRGLEEDLLVITGGVSVGEYDFVEDVLKRLGTEFYFDAIAIRPGRPAVFGRCAGKFVFGLPGNPLSTMVTFELLALPAIEILSGAPGSPLRYYKARLREEVEPKEGLTLFVPAVLERESGELWVRPLPWKGSGDVSGHARSHGYLLVPPDAESLAAGDWADILLRLGTAA